MNGTSTYVTRTPCHKACPQPGGMIHLYTYMHVALEHVFVIECQCNISCVALFFYVGTTGYRDLEETSRHVGVFFILLLSLKLLRSQNTLTSLGSIMAEFPPWLNISNLIGVHRARTCGNYLKEK